MTEPVATNRLCLSGQIACTGIAPCDLCLQAVKQFMLVPACTTAFGLASKIYEAALEAPDAESAGEAALDGLAALPKEQAALFLQTWDAGRAEVFRRVSLAVASHVKAAEDAANASQPQPDSPTTVALAAPVVEQVPAAVAPASGTNGTKRTGKKQPAISPAIETGTVITVPEEKKEAAHGRDDRDDQADQVDRQRPAGG